MPLLISHLVNVDSERKLEFSRVLFRINYNLGNSSTESNGIKLRSDFIKLLEQAYHQRKYGEAVNLGYEAVKECPDDSSARNFLIKALIQEERWQAAQDQLNDLFPTDELRNVHFLTGFMLRKMGKAKLAIAEFLKSEQHGRKGVGIQREIAHCYIMLNDYPSARKHISNALGFQPNNSHIIDMITKLEIKVGNEREAKEHLGKLELIDEPRHYNMRASAFNLKFGRPEEALKFSELSITDGGSSFFAGRVQHIKTLIVLKRFDDARTEISRLDIDWKNQKSDVKTALHCSLAIAENNYKMAYTMSNRFSIQSSDQAKGFKKKVCSALVKDVSIPFEERKKYQTELNSLSNVNEFDLVDIEG